MNEVPVFAATGAPGGGKSTLLALAVEELSAFMDVYVAEESATTLIRQGMRLKQAFALNDAAKQRMYQREILEHTFENLERMMRCAIAEGGKAIILTDRGLPDSRAYLPEGAEGDGMYRELLFSATGLSPIEALERYAGVIEMVTAAIGAEEYYTLENNPARNEPRAVAAALEERIRRAYVGHPHFIPVGNVIEGRRIGFEEKKTIALNEIRRLLGNPPVETERKFLVEGAHLAFVPFRRTVRIEQMYLRTGEDGEEVRIRRRTSDGESTHTLTKKRELSFGSRIETERRISRGEYELLSEMRDPLRRVIRKDRSYFIHEDRVFEFDAFIDPPGLCLLEVELPSIDAPVRLPGFIPIVREVTGEKAYGNHALSLLGG